jgi:hypothetical protein
MKKNRVPTSSINQPAFFLFSTLVVYVCAYREKEYLSCHRAHIEEKKKKKGERESERKKKTP